MTRAGARDSQRPQSTGRSDIEPGTRLVLAYQTDVYPEWLVLGRCPDDSHMLLVPLTDLLLVGPHDVSVSVGEGDVAYRTIARTAVRVALPAIGLASARTIATLSPAGLRRVQEQLSAAPSAAPSAISAAETLELQEHMEALEEDAVVLARAFEGVVGGRLATQDSARTGSEPSNSARPVRRPRAPRWMVYAGATATALTAGLAVAVLLPPSRLDPGLYALRSQGGELGFELRVDGKRCIARGFQGSQPCRYAPGRAVRLVYRLDPTGDDWSVSAEVETNTAPSEIMPDRRLATTNDSGSQCRRGFCLLETFTAERGWSSLTVQVRRQDSSSIRRDPILSFEFPLAPTAQ